MMIENQQITRLSCHEKEKMWFMLMASYGDIYGHFLSIVSLVGLVLYLLTSSDSGSLIIDSLASNGDNVRENGVQCTLLVYLYNVHLDVC